MEKLYFTYGGYQHPAGEVAVSNFSARREYSATGLEVRIILRMTIRGNIVADSPAAITSRIQAMSAAYAVNNQTAALRNADGSLTAHALPSAGAFGGVRVISGPNFINGQEPTEYATGRKFSVTFEADYGPNTGGILQLTPDILDFRETVGVLGNGGPRLGIREVDNGAPIIHQLSEQTPVYITQSGFVTGRYDWPAPFDPLLPNLQNPEVAPVYEGPGVFGNARIGYTTRWNYRFLSASPQPGVRPNGNIPIV